MDTSRSSNSVLTALMLARHHPANQDAPRGRVPAKQAIVATDASSPSVPFQVDMRGKTDSTRLPPGGSGGQHKASWPGEIPALGWFDIVRRTIREFSKDRIMTVAAGVTFYMLLAIFPGIAALISLYGLFSNPTTISGQLDKLAGLVPGGAMQVIGDQMNRLTEQNSSSLGFGFFIGISTAIWSASSGMKSIFEALNVVYDESEKRGFFRRSFLALLFTLGFALFFLLSLGAIVVLPIALRSLGLADISQLVVEVIKWPMLFIATVLAMSVVYVFGPSRDKPKWRWIGCGSTLAAILWLAGSLLFSWYVQNFGSFNKTYGSLGAAVGFMTWMWLSTTIFLLGAEFNSQIDHQTGCDNTVGRDRRNGAEVVDRFGASFD